MDASAFDNASVSALVGALSGGVVSYVVGARTERKSRRFASFSSVESVIEELESVAVSYWRLAGKIPDRESEIKSLIEKLDVKAQSFGRCVDRKRYSNELISRFDRLDEEITGGSFESSTRRKDSVRVQRIKALSKELKDWMYTFV